MQTRVKKKSLPLQDTKPRPSTLCGPGGVVGIVTMGWTVRGSNPGGGRDFPHLSRPTLGPSQPPVHRVFPGGKERPGRDADPSPPSSVVVMKR